VTGVFAGDPAALSVRDCIPRVHRSLICAQILL
jgi:hypothetical protein